MTDIHYAIDAYLGAAGLAPESIRKYRDILWKFADSVDQLSLEQIERHHVTAFLSRWAAASPSTRALNVTVIRRFFEFLVEEEILDDSPAARLKRPSRGRPEDLDVVTVSDTDVERLIRACRNWQEFLCLVVLCYLGVRRRAASRLRRHDLDLDRGLVRVKEKGGKVQTKPIPGELLEILREADAAGMWLEGSAYVIPSRRTPKNAERSHKVIYDTVKEVAKRAGVTTHVHALRAAFAVRYDDQLPGNTLGLKEWLGHARYETTMVYLRRKDKAAAMEPGRDLSWGSRLPHTPLMPPAGFEPAFPTTQPDNPVRRKLDELKARAATRERDGYVR